MKTADDNVPGKDILLVEDNPGDVLMTRLALEQIDPRHRLRVVGDGHEAMAILQGLDPFCDALQPDIILLDINLPCMGGREVLAAIAADEQLRQIPLSIFTSSSSDYDLVQQYDLPAECYITKPATFSDYVLAVKQALDDCGTASTKPLG